MNRFILAAAAGLPVVLSAPAVVAGPTIPAPPAVLSPDLTDPWLLQLKPNGKIVVNTPQSIPVAATTRSSGAIIRDEPATFMQRDGAILTIEDRAALEKASDYPLDPQFMPKVVAYPSSERPGTIIVDTPSRHLFLIMGGGKALRYGVGVGRPGFEWAGVHHVTRMAEWPDWTPPDEMLQRLPDLPRHMDGGPRNPLGARALYLGSSLYRIHGSNEPWTIGHAVSSGCIRMRNQDIIDLYQRVSVGAKVIVI